jgi:hypothetical protein
MGGFLGLGGIGKYYDYSGVGQLGGTLAGAGAAKAIETPMTDPKVVKSDVALLDSKLPEPTPGMPVTSQDVANAMRNEQGQVVHADGSAMQQGELELLTELANAPAEQRVAFFKQYEQAFAVNAAQTQAIRQAGEKAGQGVGTAFTGANQTERKREDIEEIVPRADWKYHLKQR